MLKIKATYDTPAVEFEPENGVFRISGRSLPANSFAFYSPVMNELKEYLKNPLPQTTFDFKLDFISSSSTKIFQEFFYELGQAHKAGYKIIVNWYYRFGDDDMKELGDDLRMETEFPFEFIAFE
ncbi:MAG: DUF1987 domain-containing protein [Bacteroidales bacterium]|nr:DUF1987 domain-containing protein [Bacteroidales bacterium]